MDLKPPPFDVNKLPVGYTEFELNGHKYEITKRIIRPNVLDYKPQDVIYEQCHCPRSRGALMRCTCYSVRKTCKNCNRPFRTNKEVKYCV